MSTDSFQMLVQSLQRCPTLKTTVTPKLLQVTWNSFRSLNPEQGDEVTSAMIVALILFDPEMFGELLTPTERTQLTTIARSASDRYLSLNHPKNQPGKLLAATLKENQKI